MFAIDAYKNQLPPAVKSFAIKVFLLLLAWELLYSCFLLPIRFPDAFFTKLTAAGTADALTYIFPKHHFECRTLVENIPPSFKESVFVDGNKLIGIADGCNAFELMVLYAGVLICLEQLQQKILWYFLIGIPFISLCNIIRCTIIGYLNITQHLDLSVFAHHYLFKIIMYAMIFAAWVSYTHKKQEDGKA